MGNYFTKKENPEYIRIRVEIQTIENRISSGLISNEKTLRLRKKDLKILNEQLKNTSKYLKEKIPISKYYGYSENRGVISCPNCSEDIWCSIPDEGQEISCDCGWEGEFYDDS